jgi:hypothetical protein
MDVIRSKFVSMYGNQVNIHGNPVSKYGNPKIQGHNPQSKVKKSKVKESKENSEVSPPVISENPLPPKPEKVKKAPLREREPVNDMERVEKVYLLNWDSLYAQGKVKEINPVVNWNQTRKLLKNHFENITAELIIQGINNGLKDDWVINAGYSLGMMLSASVLNRLINGNGSGTEEKQFGKLSEGTVDIDALYKKFGLTGPEWEKRRKLIELRNQGVVSF